jgi:hypothetical protein
MYSEISEKTMNDSLFFNKRTVVQLSEDEMIGVQGGTSTWCIAASLFALGAIVGLLDD